MPGVLSQAQASSAASKSNVQRQDDHGMLLQKLHELSNQLAASLDSDDASFKSSTPRNNPVVAQWPAPTARDLKKILQFRANRRRMDAGEFLEWPAWDMLLDLTAVEMEGRQISVSAVCISSGAPQSTALRKLSQLEDAGLIRRYQHERDRRRICVVLTDDGSRLVLETLHEDLAFYRAFSK